MTGIETVRVGFFGYGYWGPNLVRNFADTDGCTVAAICDPDRERLRLASRRYPTAILTPHYDEVLEDRTIDAVVVATPVSLHFDLALAALQRRKHVLVEKPITHSADQASRLIDEAARREVTLLVDHTFLFTPAVRKLHEMVTSGVLGQLYYFDSIRTNLGRFRDDVNVFWDVAVHDLSILQHILDEKPVALTAVGASHMPGNPENIGYLTLFFDSGMIAHITASWLSPRKIRQIIVGGSRRMVCYDDIEPDEKIKLYDRGVVSGVSPDPAHRLRVDYRRGDMWAPYLENTEALSHLAQHFRDCVRGTAKPICDGASGRQIIELLAAVDRSIADGGRRVEVGG